MLLTEAQKGWLAGFVEGDGTLGLVVSSTKDKKNDVRYPRVACRITFYNTDEAIMEHVSLLLSSMLGRPVLARRMFPKSVSTDPRQMFQITIAKTADVLALLNEIQPLMVGEKAQRATYLRRWCELRASWGSGGGTGLGEREKTLLVEYHQRWGRRSSSQVDELLH